jgi:hypothetical protein
MQHHDLKKKICSYKGLHKTEAQLLIDTKDKKLHQVYKGLSKEVVREAFDWNEEFAKV